MRDLALMFVVVVLAPLALRFPYIGLYCWEWLTLMNPHRLGYGFARELPLNFAIAGITMFAWAISSNKMDFKLRGFGVLIVLFSIWITITTFAAPVRDASYPLWERNIKTMVLTIMVVVLLSTRARLTGFIWILCVSLAYYGVKGGGFMIATAGNYIVFGPLETMIEDNNSLALALVMIAPLLNFLRTYAPNRTIKLGLVATMGLLLASVLGSYSRGGLIAMAAMLGFLWLKSRSKMNTFLVAIAVLVGVVAVMPDKYMDRISTIRDAAENDDSFKGRLDAWTVATDVALNMPLGAGFDGPRQNVVWSRFLPDAIPRASHSIYFMVLGEHGFVGLGLYLMLLLATWLTLGKVQRLTRNREDLLWAADLSKALQVGMVGFCVGGAALPMAYYDGFFTLLAAGIALLNIVEKEVRDPLANSAKFASRVASQIPIHSPGVALPAHAPRASIYSRAKL